MSKYTRGPWLPHTDGADAYVQCPDGRHFIIGDIIYHEDNKANAHLIAAAPDMCEALKLVRDGFKNGADYYDGHVSSDKNCDCFFCLGADVVDNVLAKAKGI